MGVAMKVVTKTTAADMAAPRKNRALMAFAVSAAVLGVASIYLLAPKSPANLSSTAPTVTIGGPFTLTSHTGEKFSADDLKGKPFAVFFGFTHCPEVCPTTLWEMSEAMKALGEDAEKLRMVFVSVDPERDTPEVLANYIQSFGDNVVGLTGTQAEVDAVGKAYRAYWKRVPVDGGDYTMDHTASVYLMDDKGDFSGMISYEENSETRLQKLRLLIDRSNSA
jgi:protein SCO1/2